MNFVRENTASLTDQNSFTGRDDLCCRFSTLVFQIHGMNCKSTASATTRVQKARREIEWEQPERDVRSQFLMILDIPHASDNPDVSLS